MVSYIHRLIRTNTALKVGAYSGLLLALLLSVKLTALGQAAARPQRGMAPVGSYTVSDIESISLTNGNMHLSIPLAELPPMAGGKLGWMLRAEYNSKLWDRAGWQAEFVWPNEAITYYTENYMQMSDVGGWRVGGTYQITVQMVDDDYMGILPESGLELQLTDYNWKMVLTTPDGAKHELKPIDYGPYPGTLGYKKGYYKATPRTDSINASIRYYSLDGSYIWAKIDPYTVEAGWPTSWTVVLPDGTTVEQNNGIQRIKDTNGNKVKIFTTVDGSGRETTHYQDEQTGREILNGYNSATNTIGVHYQAVGGAWQTIELNWGFTLVTGLTYQAVTSPTACWGQSPINETAVSVIRSIVFPQTEPGVPKRQYTFSYNSDQIDSVNYQWNNPCAFVSGTITQRSHGWGSVNQMVTPSGATVKYQYSLDADSEIIMASDPDSPPREFVWRKTLIHDGTSDVWAYDISNLGGKVTSPDGSITTETVYPHNPAYVAWVGDKSGLSYRINRSNKVVVERQWGLKGFSGASTIAAGGGVIVVNPVIEAEYTSLLEPDGNGNPVAVKMAAKTFQYDFNNNLLQTTEYDWFDPALVSRDAQGVPIAVPASATVLRVANNSYYNQATSSTSGNVYAKRSLSTSAPLILNALQQTSAGPSTAQFSYDDQPYGTAPIVGNLTNKRVWDDLDNKWITTSSTYGLYGNPATATDARGNVTQFFYDDATHALPNRVVVDPQNSTGTQTTTTVFDYSTGLVTSVSDANGNTSTIDYTNQLLGTIDPFGRPGVTLGPVVNINNLDKRQRITTTYLDAARQVIVATDLNSEDDKLLKTRTTSDMLGRVVLNEQTEDGVNYTLFSRKAYAELGRISLASSVMRVGTSSNTDSWTRVTNDVTGRVIEVATFGGSSQPSNTGTSSNTTGTVTTTYNAEFTTVADQLGKLRRSKTDALGRLICVDEPDGTNNLGTTDSPVQRTNYNYDVFGNLTTVTQGAQTRTFNYDSLSRLRSASNPESGTITYQYDDNGNLSQKTDARGITISYEYDALNRNTSVNYSNTTIGNPDVPDIKRFYDGATNGKGRFWFSYAGGDFSAGNNVEHTVIDSYDAPGRPTVQRQMFKLNGNWGPTYQTSRSYNLAGAVTTQTYPSGRTVTYNYDNAGRTSSFTGTLGDGTQRSYSTGIIYSPLGAMTKEQFGTATSIYNKLFYNSRGQLAEIRVSSSYTGPTDLTWNRGAIINNYSSQCAGMCTPTSSMTDNNGNLKTQEVFVPDNDQAPTANSTLRWQEYNYDSLNRLNSVREVSGDVEQWRQAFTYDRWGNRTIDTANTSGAGINNKAFTVNTTNNRLGVPGGQVGTMAYDAAGNLTTDTYTGAGDRVYDAENRMTQAWGGNNQWQSYTYNADGQRTRRKIDNVETWQVYGFEGELLAEYSANANAASPQKEYGYRNGQLLVTTENGTANAPVPTGLIANPPTTGTSVTLNWTAAAGATNYRVERKTAAAAFAFLGTTAATNFSDNGATSGNAYLYKVCAADGAGNCMSAFSNIVLGAAITFTDTTIVTKLEDPSGTTVTRAKAAHITELRTAVNAVRSLAGLPVATWTYPNIALGGIIHVEDVRELREKLDEALAALGIQNPTYTDPTLKIFSQDPLNATPIKGAHIRELRQRVTSGSGGAGGSGGPTAQLYWLIPDQLGTPRMVLDQTGSLANMKRHDYLPFGEELLAGVGGRTTSQGYSSDNVRQKFTEKERDIETGLDYLLARYYSSKQGRFISPDEFSGGPDELYYFVEAASDNPTLYADLGQPQSLNKYQYSFNNPLRYIDPDGHDPEASEPQDPNPVVPVPLPGPLPPLPIPIVGPTTGPTDQQIVDSLLKVWHAPDPYLYPVSQVIGTAPDPSTAPVPIPASTASAPVPQIQPLPWTQPQPAPPPVQAHPRKKQSTGKNKDHPKDRERPGRPNTKDRTSPNWRPKQRPPGWPKGKPWPPWKNPKPPGPAEPTPTPKPEIGPNGEPIKRRLRIL